MHNQKRNKLLSAKTRLPPLMKDHIDFTDISGPATAGQMFAPIRAERVNSTDLNHINFLQLGVVSRFRDLQLQVGENYSYLFNLRPNIAKY